MTIVFLEANSTGTTTAAMLTARRHGYRTAFVTEDRLFYGALPENPIEIADEVLDASTYDLLSVLRAIRGLDVEAVIAFDDYHLPIAAQVAEHLGLPHASLTGLLATRFKDLCRARTADTSPVAHRVLGPHDALPTALRGPVVVKPVDESGSVRVRRCDSVEELRTAVASYADHRVNARGYRPSRSLLVEEYLDGPELSCELVWDLGEGAWSVCGLTAKLLGPEPHFVEVGHVFPAALDRPTAERVVDCVRQWLDATELRCGAAHVELRLTPAGPRLVEINPRLPGGHITELVRWCTGVDMVAAYLRFHLRDGGERLRSAEPVDGGAVVAATRHLLTSEVADPAAVEAMRGAELPTRRRMVIATPPTPSTSPTETTNYDRPGFVLLASTDPDALRADLAEIEATVAGAVPAGRTP